MNFLEEVSDIKYPSYPGFVNKLLMLFSRSSCLIVVRLCCHYHYYYISPSLALLSLPLLLLLLALFLLFSLLLLHLFYRYHYHCYDYYYYYSNYCYYHHYVYHYHHHTFITGLSSRTYSRNTACRGRRISSSCVPVPEKSQSLVRWVASRLPGDAPTAGV